MNRRGFLGTILAAAVAPAIVRADSLMRVIPREASILFGDYDVEVVAGPAYYGNRLLPIDQITREALEILNQNLTFAAAVNSQYDREFASKIVKIRQPKRWA